MNRPDDLKTLEDAKPFIRSGAAFLIYLFRFGVAPTTSIPPSIDIQESYELADCFIEKLKEDLEK